MLVCKFQQMKVDFNFDFKFQILGLWHDNRQRTCCFNYIYNYKYPLYYYQL